MTDIVLIIIGILIVVLLVWLALDLRKSRKSGGAGERALAERVAGLQQELTQSMANTVGNLNSQFGNLQQTFDQRLSDNTRRVDAQIAQNSQTVSEMSKVIDKRLAQNSQSMDTRLERTAQSFAHVKELMARVETSNRQIYEVSKDVASLQDILTAPKLRGGFGELLLADLLSSILPTEHYALQHRFSGGETVDAIIRLRDDAKISVDAKFPLENFKRILAADKDADAQARARKDFVNDVKIHVKAIAQKYIVPEEGTLDFAMMYIPAENVYYETVVSDKNGANLLEFFFKHRVIPVSPNSFYAYLMTIMFGLRGMQVEKRAKELLGALDKLAREHERFSEEFELVGKHIGNAQKKYEDSTRRLGRIDNHVAKMKMGNHVQLEE
jgi:DNA recombination protein RmuC